MSPSPAKETTKISSQYSISPRRSGEILSKSLMDINDYLAEFRQDWENQIQDIRRRNDEFLAALGNPAPESGLSRNIPHLKKDDRLEDDTKSLIGTFEKLYDKVFLEDTRIPLYSYSDLSYSSLVLQLSSALEIELEHSAYQLTREIYGVKMPDYFNRDSKETIRIQFNTAMVDFSRKSCDCILNRLYPILYKNKQHNLIKQHLPNVDEILAFLNGQSLFKRLRNGAAHTEVITKEEFLKFYLQYTRFFNDNISILLAIKTHYGTIAGKHSYGSGDLHAEKILKRGIIFTDTRKLAIKYFGDDSRKDQIADCIQKHYISPIAQFGIDYKLLDLSFCMSGQFQNNPSWKDCLSNLDSFCMEHGINESVPCGLFIIGGQDVIPMPQIQNPSAHRFSGLSPNDSMEQDLESDMLYAYDRDAIQFHSSGLIKLKALLSQRPRFFVGRLPLENGRLVSSLENDLLSYFHRSVKAYSPVEDAGYGSCGLKITAPVFTACERSSVVAESVSAGLPLKTLNHLPGLTKHDIINSPSYQISPCPDSGLQYCLQQQRDADMLIFILHGTPNPRYSQYYGESSDAAEKPIAFIPDIFEKGKALIVAGICCWGARFIGYSRKESPLLTAIYNNTLLFTGACRSAFGGFDDFFQRDRRAHCAEMLLQYYLRYLLQGHDAGKALAAAKTVYFSHYAQEDGYDNAATTILEFNLFGDPLLHIRPLLPVETAPALTLVTDCDEIIETSQIYNRCSTASSVLDEVRELVDNNFKKIRHEITEHLYKYYRIDPYSLYTGHKYITRSGKKGFILRYRTTDEILISDTIVHTDEQGSILSIARSY